MAFTSYSIGNQLLALFQCLDANDCVIVAMLVAPMVVEPDETLDLRFAAVATSQLVRCFFALCAAAVAPIVFAQEGSAPCAISGDSSEEMLATFSHVPQDVARATLCIETQPVR